MVEAANDYVGGLGFFFFRFDKTSYGFCPARAFLIFSTSARV